MDVKLPPQLREAIAAHPGLPVPLVDEVSDERFVLIAEPAYRHLQELAHGELHSQREHLRQLIQEGIDSSSVPADEAFARLRASAARMAAQQQ